MVFGFFKRKKKEDSTQEEILAVVEELASIEDAEVDSDAHSVEEDEHIQAIDNDKLKHAQADNEIIVNSAIEDEEIKIDEINSNISEHKFSDVVEEHIETQALEEDYVANDVTTSDVKDADVTDEIIDDQPKKSSWFKRLRGGLSKTRDSFNKKLLGVFGGGQIDEDLYEELESILLTSDVGVNATYEILEKVRKKVSLRGLKDSSELKGALKDSILEVMSDLDKPLDTSGHTPFVIMMVGVNGAGKTTSIGKLAKYFQQQGKSVMLAAGDTFRAAAREQLIEWGNRNNVTVVTQQSGDSAAVCFDAIQSAIAKKVDIVLADTAGRLPTQLNLMEEIKKVKRVIEKALPNAPHEIMLVLDANIGQNAINQVKAFDDALGLTGLVLTKLDGTAKGGVVCAIAKERPVPLRFIGVGESVDDLRPFNAEDYANALLGDEA